MTRLTAVLAVLSAACFSAAIAADHAPSYSAPVCQVGLHGDHPAGLDQDGDAVPDSEDWCSRTPAGVRVGPNGCATGEIDIACDRGLPEPKARVVPTAVSTRPERDADGDGVRDSEDRCPGTPKGAETDANGCVKIGTVVLKGVNFGTGSAKLLPAASDTLKTVASAMKADDDIEVEIGGHTDSVGDETKNQGLSERRASSVKDFLIKEGIDADRLSTKGYGESDPTDTNDTAAGRANNRRVAFRVTKS